MAIINWTSESEVWLKDIYDYIAKENPEAATKVVSGIFEKAQILTMFPEAGYKYSSQDEGDVRIILYGHFRIAYLLKTHNNIDILGVFHGALKIENYLL